MAGELLSETGRPFTSVWFIPSASEYLHAAKGDFQAIFSLYQDGNLKLSFIGTRMELSPYRDETEMGEGFTKEWT